MNPLDELFMASTMTTMVEEFADQSEENSFIGVYEAGDRILPIANEFTFDEVTFSRGLAPVTGPQSPSKPRTALGIQKRAAEIYAIKAHVDLPAPMLMMARGAGQTMPDPEGWLASNLKNLTNEVNRTRNYWAAQSLLGATVTLSSFPNADLASPTALTYPVSTSTAAASWALAATQVRGHMNTLKKTYRRVTGFNAGEAIASDVVEGYITNNSNISTSTDGVPTLAQRKVENSYLEGGSLMRMGGLNWKFAADYYVTDANAATAAAADSAATVSEVASGTDLVAVLPTRDRWFECFAIAEGRVFLPNGLITSMALGSPSSLITEARGWGAYLELITNPIGLRLHVVWHGNLIQKRRGAAHVFDVIP
jgi:hypothetical protein